jgi:ATP-dependent RNA helicase DeaD
MRDIKVEIKRETLPSPQDVIEMKRLKIKDELQEIVETESYEGYKEFAASLLSEYTPEVAMGALLRLAFRSELDQNNYPEIRSFSVDRKGTTRIFLAVGKRDGYTAKKLVEMLKFRCGLRDKQINDLQISDNYSFVSIPFQDAETVVHKLNKLNRGSRPMAEIAREEGTEGSAPARKPRRVKSEYSSERFSGAKEAATGDTNLSSAAPVAKPKRKPKPQQSDSTKTSNEGFDWSAFMAFEDPKKWERKDTGKHSTSTSVRKTPNREIVTASQRMAAKGKKRQ